MPISCFKSSLENPRELSLFTRHFFGDLIGVPADAEPKVFPPGIAVIPIGGPERADAAMFIARAPNNPVLAFARACGVFLFFLRLLRIDGIIVMAPFRDVPGQVTDSQCIRFERAWRRRYRMAIIIALDIITNQIFGRDISDVRSSGSGGKVSPQGYFWEKPFAETGRQYSHSASVGKR
jgi:hypothetical protein